MSGRTRRETGKDAAMRRMLEKFVVAPIIPTVFPDMPVKTLIGYIQALADEKYPALEILARPLDRAVKLCRSVARADRRRISLGIGTVRTEKDARQALRAGPDFLVSPGFNRRILHLAVGRGIPYIPAVHTFQDVQDVWEAFDEEDVPLGILKLCPPEGLTRDHIRAMAGCYPGIVFCPSAVSEVTPEVISYWKQSPFIGPFMSARLVPPELLEMTDFDGVRECLRQLRVITAKPAVVPATGKTAPYFKPFVECDPYTQEDAAGLHFRKILPEGIIASVDMGLVRAQGPTHKFPGVHDFEQVYLVFRGKGYIHLNGRRFRVDRPGIVVIPRGANHSMEVDDGERMEYVYVNRH